MVFTSEMAKKYDGANVTCTAVHPGLCNPFTLSLGDAELVRSIGMINSELGRNAPKMLMSVLVCPFPFIIRRRLNTYLLIESH